MRLAAVLLLLATTLSAQTEPSGCIIKREGNYWYLYVWEHSEPDKEALKTYPIYKAHDSLKKSMADCNKWMKKMEREAAKKNHARKL